jgi:glucose/arabinose dehydrogenase
MNLVAKYIRSTTLITATLLLWVKTPAGAPAVQSSPASTQPRRTVGVGGGAGLGGYKAAADLLDTDCSGCHGGSDGRGGAVAHSLLNEKWLDSITDEQIAQIVRHGIPNTQMGGFTSEQLTDQQIFQLISYLRAQAGFIVPRKEYIADPDGKVITSEKQKFKIEVLARGLVVPWAMAFLPDGRMLITERIGNLRIYSNGKLSDPVKGAPTARVMHDGGYLDVTLHPQYAQNGWIYLAYSEILPGFTPPLPGSHSDEPPIPGGGNDPGPRIPANTVVARGRLNKDNAWVDQQVIFRSPLNLYTSSGVHYGGRLVWDKQGKLIFTLGERGNMKNAQDRVHNTLGKVLRINDDGSVPKDNPFVDTPGVDPRIWSYGHRNPEGLAWDPVTGKLWESEHGPTGGDEINIIQPGHNYGWGVISMGIQPGITERSHQGMDQPVVYYTPAIAPSGITFYTGNRYPGWKNTSLFVGGLVGEQLRRLEVRGDKVTHQEVVFSQFGRVREIVQGPDGYFYVALQNPTGVNGGRTSDDSPGIIVRLIPVP